MEIDTVRQKIDRLDARLVELLNQRLAFAAEIGRLKRSKDGRIYVAEREDRVLRKVCAQNQGPMKDAALRAIYREVMSAAIALEKPLFIASVDYHGMPTIADIFTAVEKGEADYGVIPIENSTEGSVRDALDQFVDSDLKVVAQIYLEIIHALISNSPIEKIKQVHSKDQALAQCRMWLQRYLPHAQVIESASTSSAVQIAKKTPGVAAVASPIAAEFYGVPVVATNIQDKPDNTTRFFVVGKQASGSAGGGRDMTSFLISLGDNAAAHPGALLKMLLPLAKRGINLSKIESRPSKKRPWDYFFFIDVTGHYDDPGMREAVKQLNRFCPMVKWLGSYPVAK
jgi:chorismate mutase/prephenate dehydratase